MSDALESPRAIGDIYLARGSETSIARPIMTGDVFSEIGIPGVDEDTLDSDCYGMVVSHPCSMRNGHKLNDYLQMVRVSKSPVIELNAWRQYFDRMPLPNLRSAHSDDEALTENESYVALFDLRGRVRAEQLKLANRIACLSEEGVGFLHQRMSNFDTRYAPRVSDLVASCAAPFAEAELAQEWNERLLNLDGVDEVKRDEMLAEAALEFDRVLNEPRQVPVQGGKRPQTYRLRDDLASSRKAPTARREVLKIIRNRSNPA